MATVYMRRPTGRPLSICSNKVWPWMSRLPGADHPECSFSAWAHRPRPRNGGLNPPTPIPC